MKNIDIIAKNETLNKDLVCLACYKLKHGKTCGVKACINCEFNNVKVCFDFLNQDILDNCEIEEELI